MCSELDLCQIPPTAFSGLWHAAFGARKYHFLLKIT